MARAVKGGSSDEPVISATRPGAARRSIGRPKGKRRIGKEVLIEKTADLLRTLPPEKLSLTAAAKHSGVHLTLFKYYFQDRNRLLVDIARYLTVRLGNQVMATENDQLSPIDLLTIRIDAMVDFYFENPFYHRLMVEIIRDDQDVFATEMISLWMTRTLDIYEKIIDAGVADGSLRPMDVSFTYLAIMGLCEQFQYGRLLFDKARIARDETTEEAAARYKSYLYDLLFNGLSTSHRAAQPKTAAPAR